MWFELFMNSVLPKETKWHKIASFNFKTFNAATRENLCLLLFVWSQALNYGVTYNPLSSLNEYYKLDFLYFPYWKVEHRHLMSKVVIKSVHYFLTSGSHTVGDYHHHVDKNVPEYPHMVNCPELALPCLVKYLHSVPCLCFDYIKTKNVYVQVYS